MSETHVRLENPDTGGVWDCPVDAADHYRGRGWVDSDKPLSGEGEEQPVVEAAEFDPAEHTVAEVQDYLADNPDDADRVLESERAGKNRVTLTGDIFADDDGE